MELIYISIILALIPIINFLMKYNLSRKSRELLLFKNHKTCYYDDWLFLIFNIFIPFSIVFNFKMMLIYALFCSFVYFILVNIWMKENKKEKKQSYIVDIKKGGMHPAGFVEMIFFIIEGTLLLFFLFSNIQSIFVYVQLGILLIFLIFIMPNSYKLHGEISKSDLFFTIIGIIAIILKFIYTISRI